MVAEIPKHTDILIAEVSQRGPFAQRLEITNTYSGEEIYLW